MNFWNRYLFIFRCKCIFHHVELIKKNSVAMTSFLFDNTWIFPSKKQMITCSAWICTLKFLIMVMHILGFFLPMALLGASCLSISEICPSYTLFVLTHPYNELVTLWWSISEKTCHLLTPLKFSYCFVFVLFWHY